jgi:hypothetical protein
MENLPEINLAELRKDIACIPVYRYGDTIFLPLPPELWRSCGPCACPDCKGGEGFWDTIAIAKNPDPKKPDFTWTVHCPHGATMRMMGQYYAQRKRK